MKATAMLLVLIIVLTACGSGSTNGGESGIPTQETSGCSYGAVALMLTSGDVGLAKHIFDELISHPDAKTIDTPGHALKMLGENPVVDINSWANDVHKKLLNGWQASIYIDTEFKHYIYIKSIYPTDETGDRWHIEGIETSKHNFGNPVSFNLENIDKTHDNGDVTEVEQIISGPYAGIEVIDYYLIQ